MVYKNTGQCHNSRPVYKAWIDDIGDTYLFFQDGSWFINYILCKTYDSSGCYAYMYGRSTFEATSSGANYYGYVDITFTDDIYYNYYTNSLTLEGSDSSSQCSSATSSIASNTDNETDDDDDDVYGVEGESVSFSNVDETLTTDDSESKTSENNSNNDSNNNIEWWNWMIIIALILTIASIIGIIVYFQQKVKQLQAVNDGNYRLMANH